MSPSFIERIIVAILRTHSRVRSKLWSKAVIRLVIYALALDRGLKKWLGVAKYRTCITCVTKDDQLNPYHAITHIGDFQDRTWSIITQQQAIAHIESRTWEFRVHDSQHGSVRVVVATNSHGHKYLKTEADKDTPDILMRLPRCPR